MTALLEYQDLTTLLDYIDLLNRYSRGPFQAREKCPIFPPSPVGSPVVHSVGALQEMKWFGEHVYEDIGSVVLTADQLICQLME